MTDQTEAQNPQTNTENAPHFSIEKIYVKDMSVELPNAPAIFLEQAAPEVGIQLQTNAQRLAEDAFEATLTITITSKIGDKVVFLIEVAQSGIFRAKNIPEEALNPMLSIACPNILFPYAREVVSDASTRAGFSPIILQPVNFEALYAQQQQEAQKPSNA